MKTLFLLFSIGLTIAAVTKKDRAVEHPLSDKEPGSPDYDHDAFMGKEDAKAFQELTPEESKRRLGMIVDKIDKNQDGKIDEEELEKWIVGSQSRSIREDSNKQFKSHDKDNDNNVSWDEYKESSYGFLSDDDLNDEDDSGYKKLIERDGRRWKTADLNNDGNCNLEEFQAFLHPEEFDHMRDIVAKETLEDMDKNRDGVVDLKEYIGDMFNPEDGEQEPDWVETEREQFTEYRDTNKDGHLDEQELRAWIMPDDYNHASAEAKHLIYESDDTKDGVLSKEEILNHHDKFVGSQATNWGEDLNRHEEF